MFEWLLGRRRHSANAHNLYGSIVTMTRNPDLYKVLKVPDTLEMRFELLMFHMFVFLRWLSAADWDTGKLRQALVNHFFADMETTSRQVGVGDLAIPKKMRRLATQYATRMEEYREAHSNQSDVESLELYGSIFFMDSKDPMTQARKLYAYSKRLEEALAGRDLNTILENPPALENLRNVIGT